MQIKVGDKVSVRIIPENHLLDHRDPQQEYTGNVVYVHEGHRYIIVDFEVGKAVVREAFKPDDVRAVKRKE